MPRTTIRLVLFDRNIQSQSRGGEARSMRGKLYVHLLFSKFAFRNFPWPIGFFFLETRIQAKMPNKKQESLQRQGSLVRVDNKTLHLMLARPNSHLTKTINDREAHYKEHEPEKMRVYQPKCRSHTSLHYTKCSPQNWPVWQCFWCLYGWYFSSWLVDDGASLANYLSASEYNFFF